MLAAAVLLVLVVSPCTVAGEQQWQRGLTPAAQATSNAFAPSLGQARSGRVRQVSWEETSEDTPSRRGGDAAGQATLRSILVHREGSDEPIRSAQLPRPVSEPSRDFGFTPQPVQEDDSAPDTSPRRFELQLDDDLGIPTSDALRQFDLEAVPLPTEQDGRQPADTQPFDERTVLPPTTEQPLTTLGEEDRAAMIEAERRRAEEICSQQLAELKASTLADVELGISVSGTPGLDLPIECAIDDGTLLAGRTWPETTYHWKASALCHKPLYYEDEGMERYGHSWGPYCDTLVSGVHFFGKLPVLPYCMGLEPPCECNYALGHYRPGNSAPYLIDPVPLSGRAALIQAGAVVGTAAILP